MCDIVKKKKRGEKSLSVEPGAAFVERSQIAAVMAAFSMHSCLPVCSADSHLLIDVLSSSKHPYEVAEVISLPIDQGNPPYLKWIGDVVPE